MSKKVKQKISIFKKLSKEKLSDQKAILNRCPDEVINDLIACIKEISNNPNLKLSRTKLKRLKKFKKFIRGINSGKKKNRRKYICRNLKGGFIATLVPLIASLASTAVPLISKLIG